MHFSSEYQNTVGYQSQSTPLAAAPDLPAENAQIPILADESATTKKALDEKVLVDDAASVEALPVLSVDKTVVEDTANTHVVHAFRHWLTDQQLHISCPTDDAFLSSFLRLANGCHLEASNRIQKLLKIRKKHSEWFANIDPADPGIQAVYDKGWFFLLPERDDQGRHIYIFRIVDIDPNNVDVLNWSRAGAALLDYMHLIDTKDKTGTVIIADYSRSKMETWSLLAPPEMTQFWLDMCRVNYPSGVTEVHIITNNEVAKLTENILKDTVNVKIHEESLDELYNSVPMSCLPVEYLPADYTGPNAGTVKDIIDKMKATLASPEVRERIKHVSHEQWGVATHEDTPHGPQQPPQRKQF